MMDNLRVWRHLPFHCHTDNHCKMMDNLIVWRHLSFHLHTQYDVISNMWKSVTETQFTYSVNPSTATLNTMSFQKCEKVSLNCLALYHFHNYIEYYYDYDSVYQFTYSVNPFTAVWCIPKSEKLSLNCLAIYHSHSSASAENGGQPDCLVALTLSLTHWIW